MQKNDPLVKISYPIVIVVISLVTLSIIVPNLAFAYDNNYDPALENAKNKLFSYISENKNSTYLPISSYGVDYQHLTLLVVIDDKASLTKSVYEQRIQSIVGNVPLTVEFGHFKFDLGIFTGIGNRTLGTLVKIIPANDTSNPLDKYIQVRFFDTKTNQTIQHVSFFMNITRGDHIVMNYFFHTHSGFFSVLLQPNATATTSSAYGVVPEPVLYGLMSNNGSLKIATPQFQNGLYDVRIEMLTIDSDKNLFPPTLYPKFDSWWIVDKNGNFEEYNGSSLTHSDFTTHKATISTNDTTSIIKQVLPSVELTREHNTKNVITSPLKQFKSGIAAKDIQCRQGLMLIIPTDDRSPTCLKPHTVQNLVKHGWPLNFQIYTGIYGDLGSSPILSDAYRQEIINSVMNVTGVKEWSNKWHTSMDLLGTYNPISYQYAVVHLILFPTDDALIHCEYGWTAVAKIDLTTNKILWVSFPTIKNHDCSAGISSGKITKKSNN